MFVNLRDFVCDFFSCFFCVFFIFHCRPVMAYAPRVVCAVLGAIGFSSNPTKVSKFYCMNYSTEQKRKESVFYQVGCVRCL